MFVDKEKLYYETLQLKSKIHEITSENTKLKTRLTVLEVDIELIFYMKQYKFYSNKRES